VLRLAKRSSQDRRRRRGEHHSLFLAVVGLAADMGRSSSATPAAGDASQQPVRLQLLI
jgi:hypothetical protein